MRVIKTMLITDSKHRYVYRSPELPEPYPRNSEFLGRTFFEFADYTGHLQLEKIHQWSEENIPNRGDHGCFGFPFVFKCAPDQPLFIFLAISRVGLGESEFCASSLIYPFGLDDLTPAEKECMHWIGKGVGVKGSAKRLGCSSSTIASHCQNLKRKLQVDSQQLTVVASSYASANAHISYSDA